MASAAATSKTIRPYTFQELQALKQLFDDDLLDSTLVPPVRQPEYVTEIRGLINKALASLAKEQAAAEAVSRGATEKMSATVEGARGAPPLSVQASSLDGLKVSAHFMNEFRKKINSGREDKKKWRVMGPNPWNARQEARLNVFAQDEDHYKFLSSEIVQLITTTDAQGIKTLEVIFTNPMRDDFLAALINSDHLGLLVGYLEALSPTKRKTLLSQIYSNGTTPLGTVLCRLFFHDNDRVERKMEKTPVALVLRYWDILITYGAEVTKLHRKGSFLGLLNEVCTYPKYPKAETDSGYGDYFLPVLKRPGEIFIPWDCGGSEPNAEKIGEAENYLKEWLAAINHLIKTYALAIGYKEELEQFTSLTDERKDFRWCYRLRYRTARVHVGALFRKLIIWALKNNYDKLVETEFLADGLRDDACSGVFLTLFIPESTREVNLLEFLVYLEKKELIDTTLSHYHPNKKAALTTKLPVYINKACNEAVLFAISVDKLDYVKYITHWEGEVLFLSRWEEKIDGPIHALVKRYGSMMQSKKNVVNQKVAREKFAETINLFLSRQLNEINGENKTALDIAAGLYGDGEDKDEFILSLLLFKGARTDQMHEGRYLKRGTNAIIALVKKTKEELNAILLSYLPEGSTVLEDECDYGITLSSLPANAGAGGGESDEVLSIEKLKTRGAGALHNPTQSQQHVKPSAPIVPPPAEEGDPGDEINTGLIPNIASNPSAPPPDEGVATTDIATSTPMRNKLEQVNCYQYELPPDVEEKDETVRQLLASAHALKEECTQVEAQYASPQMHEINERYNASRRAVGLSEKEMIINSGASTQVLALLKQLEKLMPDAQREIAAKKAWLATTKKREQKLQTFLRVVEECASDNEGESAAGVPEGR